jgi:hypothetical protein
MERAVICIVRDEPTALGIVDDLQSAGFSGQDISVLFPDQDGTRDFAHEQHTKSPEGAAAGGAAGGLLGGTAGWLVGIGTLAIPGLGAFVAAGPIVAALSGAAAGAAAGGLTGALIGAGIPEYEAKLYEGKLREGNLLVAVHTEDSDERDRAKQIFEAHGAEDVRVAREVDVAEDPPRVSR